MSSILVGTTKKASNYEELLAFLRYGGNYRGNLFERI